MECPDGAGTISSVNLLREQVKVRLEDSAEQPKTYRASEIRVVRSGKGKRPEDYVVPPKEELEKLRYIPPEEERTARKLGEGADLSAMLDQYLGGNSAAGGETGEVRKPGRSRNQMCIRDSLIPPPFPQQTLTPRQALFAPRQTVPLSQSRGCVCACQAAPYPPGIPVVAPGERIGKKHLAYLERIGYNRSQIEVIATSNETKEGSL